MDDSNTKHRHRKRTVGRHESRFGCTDVEDESPLCGGSEICQDEEFGYTGSKSEDSRKVHVSGNKPDAEDSSAIRDSGALAGGSQGAFSSVNFSRPDHLEWLPVEPPTFSLDKSQPYFVNREKSVRDLLFIHRDCYVRRVYKSGSAHSIGIIDNLSGMGKTAFCNLYIMQCRQLMATASSLFESGFVGSILQARTVILTLDKASLSRPMLTNEVDPGGAADDVIKQLFIEEIDKLKKLGRIRGDPRLIESAKSSKEALTQFIALTGTPLFLALDEIGNAFNESTLDNQRKLFFEFCTDVVSKWFNVDQLYFVLVGRGDFLDTVGTRIAPEISSPRKSPSPYEFPRVGLNMIRRDNVLEILQKTLVNSNSAASRISLSEYFGVEGGLGDSQTEAVIDAIMQKTNGHPRSIVDMLRSVHTLSELGNYKIGLPVSDIRKWVNDLISYQETVRELMLLANSPNSETIDLTQKVFTDVEKSISKAQLADKAFIRWEGTIEKARVFVSPPVKEKLSAMFLPFRKFISQFNTSGSEVKYDYDGSFEICFIRRFQEMFDTDESSRRHINWFAGSQFGLLDNFRANPNITMIPKVSEKGARNFVNLSQKTIHPDSWPKLLEAMHKLAANSPQCFVPQPMSSSSDVFMMTNARSKGETMRVMIGMAVKCYTGSLNATAIEDELDKFDRMFLRPGKRSINEVNILMVCCTGKYHRHKRTESDVFSTIRCTKHKNVDEVILLHLATEYDRGKFFGLLDSPELLEKLEYIVRKGANINPA